MSQLGKQIEKEVLVHLLNSKSLPSSIQTDTGVSINSGHFSSIEYEKAWEVAIELEQKNVTIDLVSLALGVNKKYNTSIANITTSLTGSGVLTLPSLKQRLLYIRKEHLRREVDLLSKELPDPLEFIEAIKTLPVDFSDSSAVSGDFLLKEYYDGAAKALDKVKENGFIGVPTGFSVIDKTCPFLGGDLVVIAASPSVGKTSLATSMAINSANKNLNVFFISAEMTASSINLRMISSISKHSYGELLTYNEVALADVAKNIDYLYDLSSRIHILETEGDDYRGILRSLISFHQKQRIDICFIDYLQLIPSPKGDRASTENERLTNMIQSFKTVAQKLNIPIVVLSQVSRDAKANNIVPELHHLRGSGGIEQTADKVICLARFDKKDIVAKANIRKNRNGEADYEFDLYFDHKTTTYRNFL